MPNATESMAHMNLLFEGSKLAARVKELMAEYEKLPDDDDEARFNYLNAINYMMGAVDMAAIYADVIKGVPPSVLMSSMDEKVKGMLSGEYGR